MRMKVPLADIVSTSTATQNLQSAALPQPLARAASQFTRSQATNLPREEINVIGCTVEEATRRVDKFLDEAALAGSPAFASFMDTARARCAAASPNFCQLASAGRKDRIMKPKIEAATAITRRVAKLKLTLAKQWLESLESHSQEMAEAGSFAERVKQQADIVRVIGEYVRLKKSGAEFHGALPLPPGKIAIVCRASGETDLSLLRLRRGRRRFQIRDGAGESPLSRKRFARSPKNAASRFPSRASVRPKSAAKISNDSAWWKCIAKRRHFSRANCTTVRKAKSPRPISKIAASIAKR